MKSSILLTTLLCVVVFSPTLNASVPAIGKGLSAAPGTRPAGKSETEINAKIRYRAPEEMNTSKSVVEGQLRRPELSVVTGDAIATRKGLLRLRTGFADRAVHESGGSIK